MTVKSTQQWSGLVVTKDATGALVAPSVGPVGVLYVNGTANGAGVTVTGTNPYKWTVTLPALVTGDCVSMYITATIATIATASVVAEDVCDALNNVHLDASQGAITWAQQKIVANVAGEGAFDIRNAAAAGYGLYTAGVYAQYNNASGPGSIGTYNIGEGVGQRNTGSGGASFGQFNDGGQTGLFADGAAGYGIQAQGGTADLDPAFPAAADPWLTVLPGAYLPGTAGAALAIAAACGLGTGATRVVYTLTDSGTGLPISDADIWITTDIAGTNVIAGGRTDALGRMTVWLDSGVTYYVWRQKDGWIFANPDTEVVP